MAQQADELTMTLNAFETNDRHVIVIGKTGAGKSTIANKILETSASNAKNQFRVSDTVLESVTKDVTAKKTLLKTEGDVYYTVQVVDTIGLFDTSALANCKSNDDTMKKIERYFRERLPGVNLILFVFKHGRWTNEEKETFKIFTSYFVGSEVSSISALVITGCDGYTREQKDKVCKEYEEKQPEMYRFMKKGVFAVSFQDVSKLIPQIQKIHKEQQKADQEKLRQLVYSCDEMKLSSHIVQENFWEKVKKLPCNIL